MAKITYCILDITNAILHILLSVPFAETKVVVQQLEELIVTISSYIELLSEAFNSNIRVRVSLPIMTGKSRKGRWTVASSRCNQECEQWGRRHDV